MEFLNFLKVKNHGNTLLLALKPIKLTPGLIFKNKFKITRERYHHANSKQSIKMTIFSLAVRPQGGQGCQKNEKNPQNSNFWVFRCDHEVLRALEAKNRTKIGVFDEIWLF